MPRWMTVPDLSVRPAVLSDVDEVLDILLEAAYWLQGRGIGQWRPESIRRELVWQRVMDGATWLASVGDEVVGTISLHWEDPLLWGQQPSNAGYVHGLAVRRAWAGRAIGAQMLAWAAETARAAGKSYLRLDCAADNQALKAY